MRKTLTLAATSLAALAFAAPAMASDLGDLTPTDTSVPVLGQSVGNTEDWDGHSTDHCNNLGSPDYYTNEVSNTGLIPGQDNASQGTSEYSIAPGGGADDCGDLEVVEATGYTNNSLPGPLGEYPDNTNDRNPGGDTEGAYIATGDSIVVPGQSDGKISAGQQGNVIP